MRGTFRQKLRNNAAAISVCVVTALSATAVVLAKNCGKGATCSRTPMSEPIRNDGICDQREAYPYMRNQDGTVMKDKKGKPVQNPYYSKADCFRGDNVCDNVTNVGELKDPAGNPVDVKKLLVQGTNMIKFKDGRPLTLPLEAEDSYDCQMAKVRANPCSGAEDAQLIDGRPLLDKPDPTTPIVQRPQEFIEMMFKNKSLVKPGNNYFVVMPNLYKESCGVGLPVCDPNIPIECFCKNHKSCVPATCGNGQLDKGEDCDPKHALKTYRVKSGYVCSYTCKWVKKTPPPPPMEMAPPVMKPDPKPKCGDDKVNQASEECDGTDKSACKGRSCTSSCKCEKPAPPPTNMGPCPNDSTVKGLKNDVGDAIDAASTKVRNAHQADPAAKVLVTVKMYVDPMGKLTGYGAYSKCAGTCDVANVDTRRLLGNLGITGRSVTAPKVHCYIRVVRTASK
ncbi:MAG: hypothetical protein AB1295_00570 [Candidatus Micrarchaeota archaeon]